MELKEIKPRTWYCEETSNYCFFPIEIDINEDYIPLAIYGLRSINTHRPVISSIRNKSFWLDGRELNIEEIQNLNNDYIKEAKNYLPPILEPLMYF